jgi:4-amino-4-deoxy-L-arabinose transferase-like glycosyltransferase
MKKVVENLQVVAVPLAFLTLALVYSILTLFYGLDFTDSFYAINRIQGDYLKEPMVFFSYAVGRWWAGWFGDSLLSFRSLNLVCYGFSCLAVISLVQRKANWAGALFFAGISLLIFASTTFHIFSYDSVAGLLTVLVACLTIHYLYDGCSIYLIASGIATALLVASRLPSAGIIPIVCLALLAANWRHSRQAKTWVARVIREWASYVISFGATLLLVIVGFYGSASAYFTALSVKLSSGGDSHGLKELVRGYLGDGKVLFFYACCLFVIGFFGARLRLPRIWIRIISLVAVALFMAATVRLDHPYSRPLTLFLSASCLLLLASRVYVGNRFDQRLVPVFLALVSFVPALGSNTGFLKVVAFWLPVVPLLCLCLPPENPRIREYCYTVLGLIVVFSLLNKQRTFYEDSSGLFWKSARITEGKLKGVHTTEPRIAYLNDVTHDVNRLRGVGRPVLLYGNMAHVFYYLLNLKPLYEQPFWMKPDDQPQVEKVRNLIGQVAPAIIVVDRYPGEEVQKVAVTGPSLEGMIKTNGYVLAERRHYRVWLPRGDSFSSSSNEVGQASSLENAEHP